ncbi:MAG: alpha/beta hydrolase [Bosea sp. (in: a-proteobacteria)]
MSDAKLQFLRVGEGVKARRIAVLVQQGYGPAIIWLGGFRSDMRATKAEALAAWASREGRSFVRFDYSGHGESEGRFEDGTISQWREDAAAVIAAFSGERPVLVGSSMGGWISLLLAHHGEVKGGLSGLVLIAPATDFTEELMWPALPEAIRDEIMEKGQWLRPSAYSPEPYPITRALFEDGRNNLLFGAPILPGCPVHILQGMMDPDVPHPHALKLIEHLPADGVALTLIKDGDHRLSRDSDIALLVATVARAVELKASP